MINTIMRILTINIILRIIEANLEDIEPTEVEIQVVSSDAKIFMAEVNEIKTHTNANIKMMAIKAIITRAIEDSIITHVEISLKVIATAILEVEVVAEAEAIIEVMLIINTISIINHSPKHCFKGEHDINDIMEKMNIVYVKPLDPTLPLRPVEIEFENNMLFGGL